MSSSSSIFAGNSRYANDFSQVIERAVAIASLPLDLLSQQRFRLSDQSIAYTTVQSKFSSLRTAFQAIQDATGTSSYLTSTSDGAIAKPSISAASSLPGSYALTVIDIGSKTNTLSAESLPDVTDPATQSISASSAFTLTVDGQQFAVSASGSSLSDLADSINGAGAGVSATLVNVGSSGALDYRLSIQSTKLGPVSIQLNDGSQDLLEAVASGSLASYQVNGQPATPISSDSRTITLSPGLSVELLAAGSSNITVDRNSAGLSSAIQTLVNSYNSALDELDKHRGKTSSVLSGSSVIASLSSSLPEFLSFTSEAGVSTFDALALSFDDKGRLSFDSEVFTAAADLDFTRLTKFLGQIDGAGFLENSDAILDVIDTEESGLLPSTLELLTEQITTQDALITENEERIERLRTSLEAQMAKADAAIAALEQQVLYYTGLFESMRVNSAGYN